MQARRGGLLSGLAGRLEALPALPLQVGVVVVQLAVFVPIALARDIDADEGLFSMAATLVADGKLPYEDFFFQQMPLLPFAYGPWMSVFGESWFGARSLSVVCATALGLLLYRHVAARFRSRALGCLAAALYASSMLVVLWMTVVKTYPLSTLLLFGAFMLADRPDLRPTARRWFASGVLLGLALDARLIFAAAVPVFLLYAWRSGADARERRSLAGAHAGGLALGLIPTLVFVGLDPRRFYFNNLGYHSVRSPGGLFGGLGAKLDMVGELLTDYPQFALLLVGSIATLVVLRASRRPLPMGFLVAALLGLASIAPNPPFAQDYSTTVPFLIVGVLELPGVLAALSAGDERARTMRRVFAVGVAVYLAIPLAAIPAETGDGYLGRGDLVASNLRLDTARDVTRALDAHTAPGETALVFWPGHLLGSHARPVAGFENDFATQGLVNAGYSEARARSYKIASPAFLDDLIRHRRVRVIVHGPLGDWTKRHDSQPLIVRSGYRPVATIGLTRIYVRGDPRPLERLVGCLRGARLRAAVNPNPPTGASAVDVTLRGNAGVSLFLYPDPGPARAAEPDIARFVGATGEVSRRGATVVAFLAGRPEAAVARRIEGCSR